jgi:Domain of unknown function (DUF1905)/Bacteriocin-protection, YdeI or OmpD-Associated
MRFQATLLLAGKTATGIEVPAEVIEGLGGGRKPAVRVTLGAYSYRSTVAPRGDRFLLGVSAENREGAGVDAGDVLDIDLALDTEQRVVSVPEDLAEALDGDAKARAFFESLTYSQQKWYVGPIG